MIIPVEPLAGAYGIALPGERRKRKYAPLAVYFARCTKEVVRLTFLEIEGLPWTAYNSRSWWNAGSRGGQGVALAWHQYGYALTRLSLAEHTAKFERTATHAEFYTPPSWLTNQRVCDNALYEIGQHMEYVRKRYGY